MYSSRILAPDWVDCDIRKKIIWKLKNRFRKVMVVCIRVRNWLKCVVNKLKLFFIICPLEEKERILTALDIFQICEQAPEFLPWVSYFHVKLIPRSVDWPWNTQWNHSSLIRLTHSHWKGRDLVWNTAYETIQNIRQEWLLGPFITVSLWFMLAVKLFDFYMWF